VSGLHELDIESDGDLFTHQNATRLECSIPGQAEVLAIDLRDRGDRDPDIALSRRERLPRRTL
jgi:hypothetical protein